MLGTKEKYVLAMATLFLIGLSAAWAGYTSFATINITQSVQELASVSGNNKSFGKQIYREGFFYFTQTGVFYIYYPQTDKVYVRITIVNPAELKEYYDFLNIKVKLYRTDAPDTYYKESLITLTNPEVIINAEGLGANGAVNWGVDVAVNGFALKSGGSPDIMLHCAIEPAEAAK
jgi:hypothetical protein